jgi:hypothetical protein
VIPYLLGNFIDTTLAPRRIYIDLGVKEWSTTPCWFLQHYPTKFDIIHGFECCQDNVRPPPEKEVQRCLDATPIFQSFRNINYTVEEVGIGGPSVP